MVSLVMDEVLCLCYFLYKSLTTESDSSDPAFQLMIQGSLDADPATNTVSQDWSVVAVDWPGSISAGVFLTIIRRSQQWWDV